VGRPIPNSKVALGLTNQHGTMTEPVNQHQREPGATFILSTTTRTERGSIREAGIDYDDPTGWKPRKASSRTVRR